jgi:short-subunit dehydrogenase
MNLATARILITGGAGGIGSAIAAELLEAGAAVMLADMNDVALAASAQRLAQFGDRVATATANLTEPASRAALCEQAVRWRVNVLVNNAGVNHFGLYDELTTAQIAQTVSINILAPMLLVHELLPYLKTQPEAHLLNMGSVFGNIGYPGYTAYSASKFAVRGFTEALRRELADSRVRVHYLAPRATRTPINSPAVEQMNAELKVAMDPPEAVARAARAVLEKGIDSVVIGWPEKLFARINALLPGVVDGAIVKQLPVIRRYAQKKSAAGGPAGNPVADNQNLRRRTV